MSLARAICPLVAVVTIGCSGSSQPPPPMCQVLCTSPSWSALSLLAGHPGGPGTVDGVGAVAHFIAPWNGGLDGQGKLYLADGNMIRAIDLATGAVRSLAGAPGINNGSYDGVGAMASFNTPSGVAATPQAVYVTDTENHTLRQIDVATATVTTIAGAYSMGGAVDDVGTAARFNEPEGLTIDHAHAHLYLGDTDNSTIRRIDLPSLQVTTIAGTALMRGTTDGVGAAARFNLPKAVVLDDTDENLYILDSNNLSIRKLSLADSTVSTVATFVDVPNGLAVDGTDVLVAVDNGITRVDGTTGAMTPFTGGSLPGFRDGALTDARFHAPAGIISDGAGSFYVADTDNYAVRKITTADGQVATLAGTSPVGSADGVGPAARFNGPWSLAADGAGTLYVADTNNQLIRKIDLASGAVTTLAGAAGMSGTTDGPLASARFTSPSGLALDGAGALYVADRDDRSIRKIDLAAGTVSTLALAQGTGFSYLSSPESLALVGKKLYVTDSGNHVVVAIELATTTATVLAGTSGTPGFADATGAKARFYSPSGLVSDGADHLYVADVLNNRVRAIQISTGAVTTLAGSNLGSDDGTGPAARFYYPTHLAIDGAGDLYVSDSLNYEVRHVALATGAVSTVIGTVTRSGVALGPLPGQLGIPTALVLIPPSGELALVSESSVLLAQ